MDRNDPQTTADGVPLYAQPYQEPDTAPQAPRVGELIAPPPPPPPGESIRKISYEDIERKIENAESSPIRTYKDDVAHQIAKNTMSVAQIAMAEAKRREKEAGLDKADVVETRFTTALIIAIALLIIGAAGVFGYILFFRTNAPSTPAVTKAQPLIIPDTDKKLDVTNMTRASLIESLQHEVVSDNSPLGSITAVTFVQNGGTALKAVSPDTFMKTLSFHIPDPLDRSFVGAFYFGVHAFRTNVPFLLLQVDSYQTALGGMIDWEKDMPYDLGELFFTDAARKDIQGSGAEFKDAIVANKDARILSNPANGETILAYTFIDKSILVIATNEFTLKELAERVRLAHLIK